MIVLVLLEEVMRALLLLIVISQAWTQEPCTNPPGCNKTIDFFLPHYDDNDGDCVVKTIIRDPTESTIVFNTTSVSVSLQWAGLIDDGFTSDKQLNATIFFECYKSYILSLLADGFSQVPESFNLDEIHYRTDILTTTSVFQVIVVTDMQSEEVYLLVLYDCRENCISSGALIITIETENVQKPYVKPITDGRAKFMFWIRRSIITEGVDCGAPTPPENGQVYYSTTTLGSQAFYTCNGDMSANSVNHIPLNMAKTCTKEERWSGPSFSCPATGPVDDDCKIGYMPNTTSNTYHILFGSFVLDAYTDSMCSVSKRFMETTMPECSPVAEERCRNLTSPGNGTVMTNGTFQWAVANYSCELGFQLVGDAVRQCQYDENGELMWSATAPSCVAEMCENLPSPANGTVMTNGTLQWAVANYSCELGFKLVGDAVRQCQYDENGELMWSATAPSCVAEMCENLPSPANGTVMTNGTLQWATAVYSCDPGYILTGDEERQCLYNDGSMLTWSGRAPRCDKDLCNDDGKGIRFDDNGDTIEVCYKGEWRSVCDDYWTDHDAKVACEQLGFSKSNFSAKATKRGVFEREFYKNANKSRLYWLDDVQCTGDEKSLFECEHREEIGTHNCGRKERAGVKCIETEIRFVDGSDEIIEVRYGSEWRSVCINHWTLNDVKVACRQLGIGTDGSHTTVLEREEKGGKYWLDFVNCHGDEESLFACHHLGLGEHKCDNGERAGVKCHN